MSEAIRPTKKQHELLEFIDEFIKAHGYSPSYREIMKGCHYTSVATVALHINNLIKRGHLQKRGRSARSIEVVGAKQTSVPAHNPVSAAQGKWLISKVEGEFKRAETGRPDQKQVDNLYVLVGALKVLGLDDAARGFISRLNQLKGR